MKINLALGLTFLVGCSHRVGGPEGVWVNHELMTKEFKETTKEIASVLERRAKEDIKLMAIDQRSVLMGRAAAVMGIDSPLYWNELTTEERAYVDGMLNTIVNPQEPDERSYEILRRTAW